MEILNNQQNPNQTTESMPQPSVPPPEVPKKSSVGLLIGLVLVGAVVLTGGVFYLIRAQSQKIEPMEKDSTVIVKTTPSPKTSVEPALSSSDEVDVISNDLENTQVSGDDPLYTDLNVDLQGL